MNKKHIILLIVITFVLKMGLAVYFTNLYKCQFPEQQVSVFANIVEETYIQPIDNLVDNGEYYIWNGSRNVYAGRMPYYGIPYYFFRQFFEKSEAKDVYAIFQVLVDSITNIFFALLCFNIMQRKSSFIIGYFIYFLNFNLVAQTVTLIPEILSISIFVLFLFAFHQYWVKNSILMTILVSIFLALVVCLKPYLLIIYPLVFISFLWKDNKLDFSNYRFIFQTALVLSLPLILLLAPWTIRNAIKLGKFIPTQESMIAGYNYTNGDMAFRRFISSWGGESLWSFPESKGCYFSIREPVNCEQIPPKEALIQGYSIEQLEKVRQDYLQLQRNYSPELDEIVVQEFDTLTKIYKTERPLMYYVGSRFIVAKSLFWHSGNNSLPINNSFKCYKPYQLIFKVVQSVVYILALTIGFIGLIILVWRRKISLIFFFIPLIIILLFLYLKLAEPRYVYHAYLLFLLGLVYVVVYFYDSIVDFWEKIKSNQIK